jgi:hypothetical protein
VIDERRHRAVDEDARVFGRRTTHDEQSGEAWSSRHAGQALDGTECVTTGAGHAFDLAPLQGTAGDLAWRPFASDDHLDAFVRLFPHLRRQAIGDLRRLAGDDGFGAFERAETRHRHLDLVVTRREGFERPRASLVASHDARRTRGPADLDLGPDQRRIRSSDSQRALERADRRTRGRLGRGLGCEFELVAVENLHRDGLPALARRLELEVERCVVRRLVEAVPHGLGDFGRGDVALGVDRELEQHVRFEPRLLRFGGVRRRLEVHDLGHHNVSGFRRGRPATGCRLIAR